MDANKWILAENIEPHKMENDLIIKTQMNKQAKEAEDLHDKLKEEGHTCMFWEECFPPRLCWCHSIPCLGK
jgi:ABC-type Zn2+ transport system substrate-binding protein/surface adhesin